MSHPERNLKSEYIYRTKLRQQICRGELWSPDKPCVIRTTYVNNVCYPQQHLCFHKPCRGRRPRRPDPSTAFVPCMACEQNTNLAPPRGLSHFCELANRNFAKPLQFLLIDYSSAKSLRSLRIYIALRDRKAVQILYSDITFI